MSDENRISWRWEIKRRSLPMGARLTGDGYTSQRAAEEVGRRALEEFIASVASEEKRG